MNNVTKSFPRALFAERGPILVGAGTFLLLVSLLAWPAQAQNWWGQRIYHLRQPAAGGIDPHPWITSITATGGVTTLTWYGLLGPYGIEMSPSLSTPTWTNVASARSSVPNWSNTVTLTNASGSMGFFRLHITNSYRGADVCNTCHGGASGEYDSWLGSPHATAMDLLTNVGMASNPACIVCHNVGVGKASGFTDLTNTPNLAQVGCESCHGPGGAHVSGNQSVVQPVVTIDSQLCGGCHDGYNYRTYSEWLDSPHAQVTPEVASFFADPTNGPTAMLLCGPCHSGAVRSALFENLVDSFPLNLPTASDATSYGQTCVICHDPHGIDRYPLYSTNFYSFVPGISSTNFSAQFDPNTQVCGQCHNLRGAQWTDTGRSPHRSPQYNVLIGLGGVGADGSVNTTNIIASHGLLNTNQCVQCHMHREKAASPSAVNPNYTGHDLQVRYDGCVLAGCHSSTNVALQLKTATQSDTAQRMQAVVNLLETWATNKAPLNLRTNYGTLAWEYTVPGEFSNPTNNPSLVGPSSAQQASIPDTIKKARFNLYLVSHDASSGVHNGPYTRWLLGVAQTNVLTELNKP